MAEKSISMWREEDASGGPYTAEVHPDEAESWMAAGWRIVEKTVGSIKEDQGDSDMGNKPKPKPRPKQA